MFQPRDADQSTCSPSTNAGSRTLRWRHQSGLPAARLDELAQPGDESARPVHRRHAPSHWTRRRESTGSRDRRVPDLLARVGLDGSVADMYPHELSGGMKQRVIIALSVALRPDLVIADEPTTALDVTIQRVVIQNLAELRDRLGVTMMVITHDMGVHAQLVDRVAVGREVVGRGQIFSSIRTGPVDRRYPPSTFANAHRTRCPCRRPPIRARRPRPHRSRSSSAV